MFVAQQGHEAVVRLLLEAHASVDVQDAMGVTALMVAAKQGHHAVARLLLEVGASLDLKDLQGHTALSFAAFLAVVR